MTILSLLLAQAVLLSAGQGNTASFHITQATVSYHVEETRLNLTKRMIVGNNEDISIELHVTRNAASGKALISSSKFKTDISMRDRMVGKILKSKENPEIVFDLSKIEGEELTKLLSPFQDNIDLKIDTRNLSLDITREGGRDGEIILVIGGTKVRVKGKLKDIVNNALSSKKGDIHVTGQLTVGGVSKVYNALISFVWTSDAAVSLSTDIEAKFSDFGITPPNVGVVILTTPDRLSLKGSVFVTMTK